MHVTKNERGEVIFEDEATVLTGEAAVEFLAEIKQRETSGMTTEEARFQRACRDAYETVWAKRSQL
jgi:hypothetical protein